MVKAALAVAHSREGFNGPMESLERETGLYQEQHDG